MKRSSTRAIVSLAICICAIIAYGIWYSFVETKNIIVAELQNQIDIKKETAGRVSFARQALSEIAGDEAIVQSYFVPETGVVSFIDNLETLGRLQKATVDVLSVSKENAKARPTIVLTVSIKGTFDAVMRTIGSIEHSPYDVSIPSLSVGKDEKNTWYADIKMLVGSIKTTP